MNEKELRMMIMESAEEIGIPESLLPENIEKRLEKKTSFFSKKVIRFAEVAAAACVLLIGGYTLEENRKGMESKQMVQNEMAANDTMRSVAEGKSAKMYEMEVAEIAEEEAMEMDAYEMEAAEATEMETEVSENRLVKEISEGDYLFRLVDHREVEIVEAAAPFSLIAVIQPDLEKGRIEDISLEDGRLHLMTESGELCYDLTRIEDPAILMEK